MSSFRKETLTKELLRHISAFVNELSNRQSMITVTNVIISDNHRQAIIGISIFPDHLSDEALEMLQRRRRDAQAYLENRLRSRHVPAIEFHIDKGEKNRQNIDRLLKNA